MKKPKTLKVTVHMLAQLRSELHQLNNSLDHIRGDLAPDDHRAFCEACEELGVDPFNR